MLAQCLTQGRFNIHPKEACSSSSGVEAFAPARVPAEHAFKVGVRLSCPVSLVTLGIRSWVTLANRKARPFGVPGVPEPDSTGQGSEIPTFRPESKQDYPPNLSILISGGKENNCDAPSNGE